MEMQDLILKEIRTNRKEITQLRIDVTTLKVKFGMIAVVFGFVGSLIKPLLAYMGTK